MVEEFDKQVVETQTGGETPVTQNKVPQNIKPVETTPVQPLPEPVTNPVSPIQQKQVSVESVTNKQPDGVNETFAKELYDYTNKYNLMTSGKEINYDKFVGKYLSSPQALESYYETILPRSKVLPFTIPFKDKNDFINKAFTPVQEAKQQDVSSFIRSPFQSDTEGYNENITKGIQEDISGNAVSIANKQENISDNITEAATIKIDDVKKKYGLMQEGKKAVVEGMVGTAEEMIPKEKSIFEKMEEAKGADPSAEKLKKIEDDITLKNWDPAYSDLSLNGIPEMDLKSAGLGEAPKFTFNTDKLNADKSNYESRKSFLTQYTDRDRELYGDNPFVRLVAPKDQVQFHWDKDVIKNGSSIDYWSTIPLEARTRTHKGALLPGEKEVSFDEYVYKDKSTVPMMDVDGIQDFEIIKKLPAPAAKIFDDYMKYLSNTDKQMAINAKAMRQMKEGSFDAPGTVEKVTGYWKDIIGKAQGKENIRVSDDLIKNYSASNGKMMSDVDELNLLNSAFDNQRRIIVGEYQSKSNPTDEDYKKAETALKKIDIIWDLTINDPANSINFTKALSKQDHAYLDELNYIEREKKEKITEEKFREKYPTLGFLKYNVFKPVIYGAEAGAVSLMSDIIDLPRKVTGYELVSKEDISTGLKEYEESVPTQLRGSIINKDGGIEFDNLLYQGAKVTTEMVGTMGFAKGFSVVLGPALNATSLPVKIKEGASVAAGAFTQYRNDAEMSCYNAMIDAGYSKEYSEAVSYDYGINTAVGWALVEPIASFPLQKSFTNNVLKDFSALLGKGYTPWKAMYKSTISNTGRIAKELTTQTAEEVSGDAWETMQNISVNRRLKTNVLDAEMTLKDIAETGLVTTAVTLFGMGKRGDLYKSSVSQKAAVWGAVNNSGVFQEQLDKWVKEGKLDKQQASFMKQGVDEVKNVITGLPSDKPLTESQKIDLGLLIYEKKKLDEEVKSGYVDELFRQQKMTEIEEKKKKLNSEILEVYNQNNDRNAVLEERDRILKEKRDAEIEAEKMVVKTRIEGLKETQKRVQSNVEELEEEEKLAEDLITAQRIREQEPAKKKARGGQAAKVAPDQRFDIKDGHHRFIAYSETGVTEVPAINKETGEQITIPVEQLQPTQDLTEKDREVIDGLKESITKGETIEPIEVEPSKIKQDAEAIRSTQERLTEAGQIAEVGQDNGGKNIQQQTQAGTETGERKAQVLKKPTKDEASRSHILNPKVNPRTADRAVTDLTTTTVGGKKIKATPSQVKVMAKEAGLEALGAKTPTQLYRQAKAQGIPMQEFLDAVDVGMGRTKGKKEFGEERKPIEKEAVSVKSSEKEKIEPVKEEDIKKNAYIVDLKNKNKSIEDKSKKVEAENKSEAGRIREQVKAETKEEVKQGLETIAEALESPDVTSSADVMVGDKKIGQWLTEQVATGKMTREEMNRINDIHTKNREKYGSAQKAKKEIEENERQMSRIEKILKGIEKLDYVGTKTTNMGIFTIPINMPIAVAKGMAKVMLKGMDMYNNAIAGRDAIKYMKDSKWYNNLSPKEKNAVNKFLKGMDTFEATALIIEDAASGSPQYKTGENLAKKVEGDIKAREKKVKSDKEIRDKAKAEEKKRGEAREKKTATKEFQRGAVEGYNFGEAYGKVKGEVAGIKKGIKKGLKEGKINQKNISEKLKEYLGLSEHKPKISSADNKRLIQKAAKVTNEQELEKFLSYYDDVLYRSVLDEASKKALKDAEKLKTRLKNRAKKPKLPVSDVNIIKAFNSLSPKQVAVNLGEKGIAEYTEIAQAILEGTGEKGARTISNADIQKFIDKVNNKIKEESDKRFIKKNEALINAMINLKIEYKNENGESVQVKPDMTSEEYRAAFDQLFQREKDSKKLEEVEEELAKQEEDQIKAQIESLNNNVSTLGGMIKSGEFKGVSKEAMKVIENISKLDAADLSLAQLSLANIVVTNIIFNKEEGVAGAGRIEAMAISQQAVKELEQFLKDNNMESFKKLLDVRVSKLKLSEHLNTDVKSLPALLVAIGGAVNGATTLRTALKIQDLGYGHSQATSDALKQWNEGLRKLAKKHGKLGRPNIAITQHAENRFRQGMYATLIQNEGGTIEEQNQWVKEQKKLIKENLKQYEGNDNKDWKKEGDLLNKIYNETFKNAETLADVHKAMNKHKPDKEVVELAMNVFENNLDKFEKASLIYGNNKIKRWNNYTHKKWKKNLSGDFKDVFEELTDDIATSGFASSEVNKKEASSALGRMKVRPDKNKVLDLDFMKTQDMAISETLYHANTLGTRFAMAEIINNPKIKKMLGATNTNLIKKKMIDAVNTQRGTTSTERQVLDAVGKVLRPLIRAKVIVTLGGPTAYLRQMTGAIMGAYIRSGFKRTVFVNMATKVDDNLFSKSNFRNRFLATKIGGMEKGINRKSPAYRLTEKAAQRISYISEGLSEGMLGMKPLSYGDYHAAKGAWMTYYEQYKKNNGGGSVDWKEESKNPDEKASAYADQMIETTMNVNDMSMAGDMFRKQDAANLIARSILSPYGSFVTNQDMRMSKAFKSMFHHPFEKERREGVLDLLSIAGEQLTFQYTAMAMDALTAYLMINLGYAVFGGDDEEKEEMINTKMKQIVGPGVNKKAALNAFGDLLPTSAIVSPLVSNYVESKLKRVTNDWLVDLFDLKDEDGKPMNLFTTRYVNQSEDPNFAGSVSEESMMHFGLVGGVIDDIDNYFSEIARTFSGEYYKYDKEGKVKKVIKLDDRQQNLMLTNLILKTVGFFGVGNKETRSFQNLFLKQIKTDLKESAKRKGGRGSMYKGTYSGAGYGKSGY